LGNPLFSQAADQLGNARLILIAAVVASLGFQRTCGPATWAVAVAVFATMSIATWCR
jgi:hypothetical protein